MAGGAIKWQPAQSSVTCRRLPNIPAPDDGGALHARQIRCFGTSHSLLEAQLDASSVSRLGSSVSPDVDWKVSPSTQITVAIMLRDFVNSLEEMSVC